MLTIGIIKNPKKVADRIKEILNVKCPA